MEISSKLSDYKRYLCTHGSLSLVIRLSPAISPSKIKEIVTENIDGKDIELWRIQVSAPAEDDRANKELKNLLSSLFDVRKNNINIESGKHARDKIVRIDL
ncbi:MAG: DUF167 domain-containing protein [Candidatus Gracilibacteria bacterium]